MNPPNHNFNLNVITQSLYFEKCITKVDCKRKIPKSDELNLFAISYFQFKT
jgi:hypothetical protein